MDIQKFADGIAEIGNKERSSYHLTYGDLIDALRAAPEDATLDERVVGLGSYRGYYYDIALYTEREGCSASDTAEQFDGNNYDEWRRKHEVGADTIPSKAHELADFLEGLLGNYFTGYKGGEYEITRDKPLWVAEDSGDCADLAVMAISQDLKLITKLIEV